MSDYWMDRLRYVVLHSHPEGLVLSQQMREQIMQRGTVLDIIECSTYSLQSEYFKRITRRPLTLILWGMEDRYGVAEREGVEVITARDYGGVSLLVEGLRRVVVEETQDSRREMWDNPDDPTWTERAARFVRVEV